MTDRKVSELDFRMPEYRDARPEDYEFRLDGKLVRKDRWERAVNSVCHLVGLSTREFETSDVVDAVRKLVIEQEGWMDLSHPDDDWPIDGACVDLRLADGSLLKGAVFHKSAPCWVWREIEYSTDVAAWRESPGAPDNSILKKET